LQIFCIIKVQQLAAGGSLNIFGDFRANLTTKDFLGFFGCERLYHGPIISQSDNIFKVLISQEASQRFALAAGGRAWIRLGSRKKPEARKMLENAAESHQSAARFVRRFRVAQDSPPEKDFTA
jgi:hypothetical protein